MRKTSIILFAALLLIVVLGMPSCNAQPSVEKDGSICIATWNVQNLFNAVSDGGEYEEYRPESGWDRKSYEKRLSDDRKVIGYLPDTGELIVVLNEVEGPDVVEDLIKSDDLPVPGLRWYACTESEDSAVQTAVVSSIPISHANVHDVGEGLRPVFEVCFETDRGKLFVLAVHFKSNIGGTEETASRREAAALVVAQVAAEIERGNPGCLVMVCGDMNEECWDEGLMGQDGPLPASGTFGRRSWYCFWKDPQSALWPNGSYWYGGSWKCYDNILVSASGRDGAGLELTGYGVVFKGILSNAGKKPAAWDRRLLTGVSDHLPVWVTVR